MRKVNKSLQKEINERTIYEAVWNGRVWNIEDHNCVKIAEADGITCICNKAGMYALINQISFSKVIKAISFKNYIHGESIKSKNLHTSDLLPPAVR